MLGFNMILRIVTNGRNKPLADQPARPGDVRPPAALGRRRVDSDVEPENFGRGKCPIIAALLGVEEPRIFARPKPKNSSALA